MKKLRSVSKKQMEVLTWWHHLSKFKDKDAIICDGAIRSGKSFSMFLSFVLWSFEKYNGQSFGLCGKTISSITRNIIEPMSEYLMGLGFEIDYKKSENKMRIRYNRRGNTYYIFGGKDSGATSLIQGITLAGVMFDEVVLMPEVFVDQALARCSVSGSKYWFNCNPDHPRHWFYKEWIEKQQQKNVLYIHFKMEDNPSLTQEIKDRYKKIYKGSFYQKYVEGKWCMAEGLVYPQFKEGENIIKELPNVMEKYYVSCDYGTVNPMSMGLWGFNQGVWYRIKEYYYSSRKEGMLKTDEEYYKELENLIGDREIEAVVIDPSAANFCQCIRYHKKYQVIAAKNEVIKGICEVTQALNKGKIKIHKSCEDAIREFALYQWKTTDEVPKKENDHAMDDIRYFVSTVLAQDGRVKESEYVFKSISRNG